MLRNNSISTMRINAKHFLKTNLKYINMKLTNKTILITGGGTGIGLALAAALEEQNNTVIITGRRLDKLKAAAKKIPALQFFQCDVTDPASIDILFQHLKQKNIVLDVVFNNAGVIELWDIAHETITSNDIFTKINTNLTGPICLTQNFIRQANTDNKNYIINITSQAAIMPVPIMPLYSTSKAGLSVFTQILRQQLKGSNFKVVEIIPPATETSMTTQDIKNTTKLMETGYIAGKILETVEKGKGEYAPGSNVVILRILRRFFPKAGLSLIDKLSRKQIAV